LTKQENCGIIYVYEKSEVYKMVTYVQYMLSMVDEVTNYFFDKTNSLYWTRDGLQWNLHGSIPPMTDIGASIINAIVTIMYSQIIEMAKLSIIFSGE
jgi:hypothetical protein